MKTTTHSTKGVCSRAIHISLTPENTISSVSFDGGCPGNALGIAQLVKGKTPTEVIQQLEGLPCGDKPSSCPDQLAAALKELI